MTTWPNILPIYPLLENYSETLVDNVIRTEMETGPAKLRRRSTASVRKLSISYFLNKEQVEALDNFYLTILQSGCVSFVHTHPRNESAIECRFAKAPQYKAANGNYFKVDIELEVLP